VKHRPIDQQVVAIMGSASGIGRETAFQFASRGAKLVIADNDAKGLKSLTGELRTTGNRPYLRRRMVGRVGQR